MKHQIKLKKDRGFSLVEMLVVIAVIGIIAGIAVPSIGAINGKANEAKAKRNGQTIASLYNSSRGVGAVYPVKTTSGIVDKLVAGVTGPDLAGSNFKMSTMADEERAAAMKYVSYDASADLMIYDPAGGQEAVEATIGEAIEIASMMNVHMMILHMEESDMTWTDDGPVPGPYEYYYEELGYLNPETNQYQQDMPMREVDFGFGETQMEPYHWLEPQGQIFRRPRA